MKRNLGLTATRRLRVESLEHRRLLAVAAFETEIYSDNGGVPGELLVDNTVVAGETFFLRVTAEEFDPFLYGLRTASLDVDWDAALLDVVEADWDLDSVITADLPLFHSGTLDNAAGRIDELSGTAMLSGGAGRSIGNMHPETFAMIRMQAGDEPGTASIALSKSETKTITVPSMVLQDEHLRFEAATVTIVAASPVTVPEVMPPIETTAGPPFTDSAELAATAEIVEPVETPQIPVPSEPEPLPPSPVPGEPQTLEPAFVTEASVTLNFDANQDGVFDFADFGWLNMQVVTAQPGPAEPLEPAEPLPVEAAEESPADSAGELVEVVPAADHSAGEFQHVCIAVRPGDVVAAETWMDALAQAWLADAEARRNRPGMF